MKNELKYLLEHSISKYRNTNMLGRMSLDTEPADLLITERSQESLKQKPIPFYMKCSVPVNEKAQKLHRILEEET